MVLQNAKKKRSARKRWYVLTITSIDIVHETQHIRGRFELFWRLYYGLSGNGRQKFLGRVVVGVHRIRSALNP